MICTRPRKTKCFSSFLFLKLGRSLNIFFFLIFLIFRGFFLVSCQKANKNVDILYHANGHEKQKNILFSLKEFEQETIISEQEGQMLPFMWKRNWVEYCNGMYKKIQTEYWHDMQLEMKSGNMFH